MKEKCTVVKEDNTNWADVKLVYSLDADNPHGGRLSQKIDVQRGFAQFVQPVTFTAGRYRVSLWMRAQPALIRATPRSR